LLAALAFFPLVRARAAAPALTSPVLSTNAVTGPWFPVPYISSTTFNAQITALDASTGVYISSISPVDLITLWHFDEGTGATAYDSSGQYDTGTIVNSPTWTAGLFGNALTFNGTSQWVYGATDYTTEPTTYTEELWFKTTTTSGGKLIGYENSQIYQGGATGATNYDANIYMINSGQIEAGNYVPSLGTEQTLTSPLSYNDGKWHQVVAQLSPTSGSSLFIDGTLVAQNTTHTQVQQFSGYWHVGAGNLGAWPNQPTSYYFAGTIDEVRVSTFIVSSLQIAKDYLAGNTGSNTLPNSAGLLVSTTQPSGLYAQWHLDESSGTFALDASGNGRNGTIVDNPPYVTGTDGLALSLNGSNQYFYSPLLPSFPTVLTEELWFKTTENSGTEDLIDLDHSPTLSAGSIDRLIRMTSTGLVGFYVYSGGAGYSIASASAYNDGNWHRAAATLSPTLGMQLYVDGVQVAANSSVTSADNYTDGGPYIIVGSGSEGYFNGAIDEVRFSTVALNSQQIALEYLSDTAAALHVNQPYEVLYSSTSGATWAFAPVSSTTLTGTNGTVAAQTLQSNAFSVLFSTGLNSTVDQVEVVAQNRTGAVTETKFYVIIDTTQPTAPSITSLSSPTTYTLQANGVTGSADLLSGLAALPYNVQFATSATFSPVAANTGFVAGPTATGTGLNPNTTYYARVQAQSEDGVVSPYSNVVLLPTLSNPVSIPSGAPVTITASSITEGWAALPTSPSSATCEGYELDVSTTNFASGTVYSSTTFSDLASTLTVSGLNTGTTMYLRVATFNWNGAPNYVFLSSANIQISPSIATIVMGLDSNVVFSTVSVSSVVITNVGNLPLTLVVSGSTTTAGSPWVLSVSSSVEAPVLQGEWNSTQPTSASFATAITNAPVSSTAGANYAGGQSGQSVPSGASVTMWFKFWAPTSTTAGNTQQVLQVLYQAVYP
jgi:hypothetical protein